MKMANTTACVIANGGSICVGANALRAETFTKPCTTRTKTFKQSDATAVITKPDRGGRECPLSAISGHEHCSFDHFIINFFFNIGRISMKAGEARGIQGSTGKWVSNVSLISITFSLVNPPPAASSEIALR
jgi:hypothetical protein